MNRSLCPRERIRISLSSSRVELRFTQERYWKARCAVEVKLLSLSFLSS